VSKGLKLAAVFFLILLAFTSCLIVAVEKDSMEAELSFRQSRERIAGLSRNSPGCSVPNHLKMLVYDPDEGKLVKMSLPFWLVKMGLRGPLEEPDEHLKGKKLDYDFDVKALSKAISRMPRGLLVEIWGEEEKLLLWLE